MIENLELIVPFNKAIMQRSLFIMPVMAAFFLFLLFIVRYWLKHIFNYYVTLLLSSILIFFIAMFLFGGIYGIFAIKDDQPAAILNQKGIWIKRFEFIPWDEIEEMDIYRVSGTPIESIGIRVKDLKKLSKQSSLAGKAGVFWSRIFGYPPIIIANITVPNDEVLSFAQKFIKK